MQSDAERCAILLIGWISAPVHAKLWYVPQDVVLAVFPVEPNGARRCLQALQTCFVQFLHDLSSPTCRVPWRPTPAETASLSAVATAVGGGAPPGAPEAHGFDIRLAFCEEAGAVLAQVSAADCFVSEEHVGVALFEPATLKGSGLYTTVLGGLGRCSTAGSLLQSAPSSNWTALLSCVSQCLGISHQTAAAPRPSFSTWALLKAAVRFVLCNVHARPQAALLSKHVMLWFRVWLLQGQMKLMSPASNTPAMLNTAMHLLQVVARKGAALAELGEDMQGLLDECARVRSALDLQVEHQRHSAATAFQMEPVTRCAVGATEVPLPSGALAGDAAKRDTPDFAALVRRHLQTRHPPPVGAGVSSLLGWLPSVDLGRRLDIHLALHSIEQAMFSLAPQLDAWQGGLDGGEVEQLTDTYRDLSHKARSWGIMAMELQSMEVVVVWIAFCVVHASAHRAHPIVGEYGAPLALDRLACLVLSSRQAIDAVRHVHCYLSAHVRAGKAIFTLEDEAPTYGMAARYVRGDRCLWAMWATEEVNAESRIDEHWREVQRKKRRVAELRAEISAKKSEKKQLDAQIAEVDALHAQIRSLTSRISRACHCHLWCPLLSGQSCATCSRNDELRKERQWVQSVLDGKHEHRLRQSLAAVVQQLRGLESELSREAKPPAAVWQPLPRQACAAHPVLFFLHMPPWLRCLARTSFLARQVALPYPWACAGRWDLTHSTAVQPFCTLWVAYYNECQTNRTWLPSQATPPAGSDGAVLLFSRDRRPSEEAVSGTHMDHMNDRESGVFWPDSWGLRMAWKTTGLTVGSGQLFNPFCPVAEAVLVDFFTPRLPPPSSHLQWALPLPQVPSRARGN